MSQRGEKGAAQSKSEKDEKRKSSAIADGLRPESLPEITYNGWKDWDDTMLKLKEYMRSNFQDLQIICPDPMLLTIKPAYKVYDFKPPNFTLMESFTDITDPKGYRAKMIMNDINTDRALVNKRRMKQMDDRESVYRLIRTMCSPSLNAILTVKAKFITVELDYPLKLLEVIKSVVTSRCDGNQEFERYQALQDWYTLTMSTDEDIVPYGRRAVKLFDRLAATAFGICASGTHVAASRSKSLTARRPYGTMFSPVLIVSVYQSRRAWDRSNS